MHEILKGFPLQVDPNLLVGHAGADDAGVYRIDAERALVLTVDFFTPVVDDPFDYGRVAAANSLSDVYAMGGKPLVALNIAAFPDSDLPDGVLADILRGGAAVAKEAGIVIAGGHTVKDKELKYGLSVVGMVHPDRIIENAGAEPGDRLILTKALGTGILTTGLKAEDLDDKDYGTLMESMTRLNSTASEPMESFDVHACTDITGFGLIGHAFEMARGSDAVIELSASDVPLLPGTARAVEKGYLTGGGATNRRYTEGHVEWKRTKDETLEHILYDPQTSGGLLVAVPEDQSEDLLSKIQKSCAEARIVGRVTETGKSGIRVV